MSDESDEGGSAFAFKALPPGLTTPVTTSTKRAEPAWLSEWKDRGAPASPSSSSSSDVLLADTRNKAAAKSTAGSKPSAAPTAAAAADGAKTKVKADPPPKSPKPHPGGPKSKVAASTLPLTMPERVARSKGPLATSVPLKLPNAALRASKVLVEVPGDCEAADLDGDIGAVGRFNVVDSKGGAMQVDLKGVIYDAAVVPSYALLVVNIGPTEAKVEAVMNDFVQLHARELVAEVERQAFEFGDDADSDDDADTRKRKKKGAAAAAAAAKRAKKGGEQEADAEGADAVLGDRSKTTAKPKAKARGAGAKRGGKAGAPKLKAGAARKPPAKPKK